MMMANMFNHAQSFSVSVTSASTTRMHLPAAGKHHVHASCKGQPSCAIVVHVLMHRHYEIQELTLLLHRQTAEGEVRRKRRTMIFCSSVDSCRAVEHALRERGLPTLCYHGDVPVEERGRAMQEFSGVEDNERDPLANADIHAGLENIVVHGANVARSGNGRKAAQTLSLQLEEEAEEVPLLVCSDLAARCAFHMKQCANK